MGATPFVMTVEAANAREAYNMLVDEALMRYGNDPYNGTITTCSLGACKLSFGVYKEGNKAEAERLIDSLDGGSKWTADYINLGIVNFRVPDVEKTNKKYDARFRLKYVVENINDAQPPLTAKPIFDSKSEADKYALGLARQGHSVCVRRVPVKGTGNDVVSTFEVCERTIKKPTQNERKTAIPIHRYIFFGLAAC